MTAPNVASPHADAAMLEEEIRRSGEGSALGLVLLHGRGAAASGMLQLGRDLVEQADSVWQGEARSDSPVSVRLAAPQAADRSWYPGSFLEPLERNEPWLSSALEAVGRASDGLEARGVPRRRQMFVGFSQGACLAAEFLGRHAERWGGLIAFTGGFQGPDGREPDFEGDFAGTPMFFGTGSPDPHVPLARVEETADRFEQMGALVERLILPGRPHTISAEEGACAVRLLAGAG